MPPAAQIFEKGQEALSPTLQELIREHIERASHDLDMTKPTPSSFAPSSSEILPREMGDYFCRTAMMWAYMTDGLVKEPRLEEATFRAHERSRARSSMSDLSEVSKIDLDISRLRYDNKIRDMTIEFSNQVQSTWWPQTPMMSAPLDVPFSSISPFCDARLSAMSSKSMTLSSDGDQRSFKTRKLLPDSHVQLHADVGQRSDDSDESDDELFLDIDMEALRQRGKGSYSCPKAYQCKKGGVDKEGKLVIFDRNSSFAQHCNKHRKPWRCDIPGCPNPPKKRRFARRDGLERHKATVKHYVVG